MDLGGREGKVPVPAERLWWRQGDPAVVDGCYAQADISAENDDGQPNYRFFFVQNPSA